MKQETTPRESRSDELLKGVQQAYTRILQKSEKTSCCGAPDVCATPDYSAAELAQLPTEAVQSSFGCGNPLKFAEVKAGQTVLDIGSGAGIDCFLAAARVGPHGKVIGLDMTSAMIEKARKIASERGYANVEFRQGTADRMPIEAASVDWIISNCVINLAPDKPAVFREAFRILKPGGRLSISDIVLGGDLPPEILSNFEAYVGCVAGAIREADYLEAMRQAGFVEVQVASRFVHGQEHLQDWLRSTNPDVPSCCGSSPAQKAEGLIAAVAGKIWSAEIKALKPATDRK